MFHCSGLIKIKITEMKKTLLILSITILAISAFSQQYITKNGHIKFYSETPIETIEAHNKQVNSILDIHTGDFVFKILMKSFEFEKALMQEHFNENYVESDKFPNAMFKGKVINLGEIDFTKSGEYPAIVEGEMTIHGETKSIQTSGTLLITDAETIKGNAVFMVKPADYNIKIPNTVVANIAEEIEVSVEVPMQLLKK
jgi:hypothetical protein